MEFLYKIYENQNFALILFSIIAILLILFIVVLLAALNDTKKRKIADLEAKEQQEINTLESQAVNNAPVGTETQAFTTQEPRQSLDFFANEEDISKTRDITFTNPTTENSMNGLLEEFEESKEVVDSVTSSVVSPQEVVQSNPVVQPIETPVVEATVVEPAVELPEEPKEEAVEPEIDFASLVEQETEDKTVKTPDQFSSVYVEEQEENLELPAMKEEETELPKENATSVNLEKTGVLDFGNIESESYEIK